MFLGFGYVWWHIGVLCGLKVGSPPVAYSIFNDPFLAKNLKSDLLIGPTALQQAKSQYANNPKISRIYVVREVPGLRSV